MADDKGLNQALENHRNQLEQTSTKHYRIWMNRAALIRNTHNTESAWSKRNRRDRKSGPGSLQLSGALSRARDSHVALSVRPRATPNAAMSVDTPHQAEQNRRQRR